MCSVLLSFISRLPQTQPEINKKLKLSVVYGTLSSSIIITAVGVTFVTLFHLYGTNLFKGSELLYEGTVGLVASLLIAFTSFAFMKGTTLYEKLHTKLGKSVAMIDENNTIAGDTLEDSQSESVKNTSNYSTASKAFFWIPFLTIMREGLETILIIGGVSFSEDVSSIPLAAIVGIIAGILVGILIHRASGQLSLNVFFISASYFLLLMAAGIMSRSVGLIQDHVWLSFVGLNDEATSAFDVRGNVWFLSCCSQKTNPYFGILYSIVGYRNIATIGTIVCYCGFWIIISGLLVILKLVERRKESQKKWRSYQKEMELSTVEHQEIV